MFPPLARNTISFSLNGFMGAIGIDYYSPNPENILLGCDDERADKKFIK